MPAVLGRSGRLLPRRLAVLECVEARTSMHARWLGAVPSMQRSPQHIRPARL